MTGSLAGFKATLDAVQPPSGLTPALEALWWDAKENWDKAHDRAMTVEGPDGALVHAYLHRKEGDPDNAAYWYRRAGRPLSPGRSMRNGRRLSRTCSRARLPPMVEAALTYTANTGDKPATGATARAENLEQRRGTLEEHRFSIHDGRPQQDAFSLEREGFQFVRHDTRVTDFYDAAQVRDTYYPEMERLVQQVSGCRRVLVFDHTLRTMDEAIRESRGVRGPVKVVHNDYTEWSGPQRVRDLLPDEADRLLQHRVAVIQVWRPIRNPVEAEPLAICDARTIAPGDLIAADRLYENRRGEIYQVAYNAAHVWYYFPRMRRDEALVFKCYDSQTDGRARFTAHSAFVDPTSPANAAPRESIEIRTLAFWAPDA